MDKFKPHRMYDSQKAETRKEHLSLKSKGYGHSPNKMRSSPLSGMMSSIGRTSPLNCWSGYSASTTKPSPSGKKTPGGNIKQVPACEKD